VFIASFVGLDDAEGRGFEPRICFVVSQNRLR